MGANTFFSNAEAYAYEILQQKLIKEAQRSAQQTVMELSALRSLFNQGQFIYCIPFGGTGLLGPNPYTPHPTYPNFYPIDPNFISQEPHYLPYPLPQPPPPHPQAPQSSSPPPCGPGNPIQPSHNSHSQSQNQQSTVHVNIKNQPKLIPAKQGTDECNIGKEGIDVTIDMREYIPAEINVNVEEKCVEIKACHVSEVGSKTFARRYDLPACIILDSVKCVLSHDGYLHFSAAWVKME